VHQPNPWILLMGGFALFNVAGMAYGMKAPEWARIAAAVLCLALGLLSIGLAFKRQFAKKPVPPPKPPPRRVSTPKPPRPRDEP